MSTPEVPILQQYLKKKGSKLGLWHKRFCLLFHDRIEIRKKAKHEETGKSIRITSQTNAILADHELTIAAPDVPPITLASEEHDALFNWAHNIRRLTLLTPNMAIDNFEVVKVLGRGFYGKVHLCKEKATGQCFAIKMVHKNRLLSSNKFHTIFTERDVLMNMRHPFIVSLCFAFESDSKLYLGLEYASGGALFYHLQHRGKFPIEEVQLFIAELSLALNYLHNKGVIYRDLKPENILLDRDGHVKLTDVALSKVMTVTSTTKPLLGTSEYLAPEIVSMRPYGFEVDWWALGILTFELLFGKTPFYSQNKTKLLEEICSGKVTFPKGADFVTQDFVSMLLKKDPSERAGFDMIMNHPWFKDLNFEDVLMKRVQPPFVPPSREDEPGTLDEEFMVENPEDSLGTPASSTQGFSYVESMPGDDDYIESSSGPGVDPSFLNDDDLPPV